MGKPSFISFYSQLAMLLRDLPAGTTADLTDWAKAYWNGHRVVGLFLREGDSGKLDEDFELNENAWEDWHDDLVVWLAAPRFSACAELKQWLKDAP